MRKRRLKPRPPLPGQIPLAWDRDGEPFRPPPDAVGWKIRRSTGKPGKARNPYRLLWIDLAPAQTVEEVKRG